MKIKNLFLIMITVSLALILVGNVSAEFCEDTDGKDYHTPGVACEWFEDEDDKECFNDRCFNSEVVEYFCEDGMYLTSEHYNCPNGCEGGMCVGGDIPEGEWPIGDTDFYCSGEEGQSDCWITNLDNSDGKLKFVLNRVLAGHNLPTVKEENLEASLEVSRLSDGSYDVIIRLEDGEYFAPSDSDALADNGLYVLTAIVVIGAGAWYFMKKK